MTEEKAMNRTVNTVAVAVAVAVALATVLAPAAWAQISIVAVGVPVTEDFNTLASSGTSSATPAGWVFLETGTNANTTYNTGTGTNTAGDTYSFGSALSSERAFGGLLSSSLVPTLGASFRNDTGAILSSLDIAYTGEQWRCGATARVDRIDFQYSLDATSLSTGTWVDVDALDFASPNTAAAGALDGNLAGNRTVLASNVGSLAIAPGATFWIRWTDFNAAGSDDGLSIDDFSLRGNEPPVSTAASTWGRLKGIYR
jgi:hypothetical protein